MIESTKIYRSYYDAISTLSKEDKLLLWEAIMDFSFNDKEPELQGVNKTVWLLIRPTLVSSIKSIKGGCQGGLSRGVIKPPYKPTRVK